MLITFEQCIIIQKNQWKYAITMTTLLLTAYKHATWIIHQKIYKIISKIKSSSSTFLYKKQKKYWLHETITKNLLIIMKIGELILFLCVVIRYIRKLLFHYYISCCVNVIYVNYTLLWKTKSSKYWKDVR